MLCGGLYGIKSMKQTDAQVEAQARLAGKNKDKAKKGGKGNVDKEFWERVIKLVKQLIPTWKCKEVAYVSILAVLLIIRTMMSIWLADVNGRVVKAIVEKNLKMFIYRVSNPANLDISYFRFSYFSSLRCRHQLSTLQLTISKRSWP